MKKNTTCHRTLFLWKKEHFLSKEMYFLSQEIYILSQEIYFLSHQIYFLSQEIYFLWQEIIFLWQSCHWLQFCDYYCVDNVAIFPVVSGEIVYWKIRFPRNFKYYPTLNNRYLLIGIAPWPCNRRFCHFVSMYGKNMVRILRRKNEQPAYHFQSCLC